MADRKIEKITNLRPYPKNPREGDIGAIVTSLKTLGQYRPIVVNKRPGVETTMTVLAGNHTLKAATALGWTEIAVTWVDVDDETAERIVLVDNRTNDLATYNSQLLADLLVELAATDTGLAGTGYDGDDLDTLLADLQRLDEPDEPETIIEPPAEPTTKVGDVWALGKHRLTCGDAFDVVLQGDCIVTDPPYGMRLDTDYSKIINRQGRAGKNYRPVIGDDKDFDPTPLFDRYADLKEQLWFGADYYRQHLPSGGSWFVWDKRDTGDDTTTDGADRLFGSQFELVWTRTPRRREILRFLWVGFIGKPGAGAGARHHPTQKPVSLMEHLINLTDGIVLDLFAGSGSTLIAADNLGRVCHAVELDPAYCDVIVKRWESLSPDHHADLMG